MPNTVSLTGPATTQSFIRGSLPQAASTPNYPGSAYFNWGGGTDLGNIYSNSGAFVTAAGGGVGTRGLIPKQNYTGLGAFVNALDPTSKSSLDAWKAEERRQSELDNGYFNIGPIAGLVGPGLALSGVGLPLAALGGAIGGAFSGQGLKGALLGGLSGAAGAGGGSWLSNFAGLGDLGLSASQGAALGGAAIGGASGALTGGKLGALTGAISGGAGAYFNAPSANAGSAYADNIDDSLSVFGNNGYVSAGDDALGGFAANAEPAVTTGGKALFGNSAQALGSGLGGLLSDTAADATPAATAGSTGMAGGKYSSLLSPILSGGIGLYTNEQAKNDILDAQKKNLDLLSPYLTESFDPGDLTNDPGYQFQLQQGTDAINRTAAARGNYFSGQALTDAAKYSQGLADTTYGDAFNRWLQTQGQKLGAAGAVANTNDAVGNTQANALMNQGNVLSGSLASALGGMGLGDGSYTNGLGQTLGGNNYSDLLTKLLLAQQGAK